MSDVEHRLIDATVEHLRAEALEATWEPAPAGAGRDAVGQLHVRWSGGSHSFPAVVKSGLRPGSVGLLPDVRGGVVLTDSVTRTVRDALADAGWGFVDGAGNAALSAPGLTVRVEGRRASRKVLPPIGLPFTTLGLPVTFVLLVRGGMGDGGTQRELARLSRTSLGSTNRVLQALRSLGHLTPDGQLARRGALLDRWTEAYLVQRDSLGAAQTFSTDLWASAADVMEAALPHGALLGSELGARAEGHSIRPVTALFYCGEQARQDLIRAGRLRPDDTGWVEVREAFWAAELLGVDARTVPAFLIRADMLAAGDPRLTALARTLEP